MSNQSFKNLLKEYLLTSTYIGLIKLLRSKHVFNVIIWAVFNFLSVLTCVFFLMPTITSYLNYPVVTNIETIYEQPMEYPGFTLCSYDWNVFELSSVLVYCSIGYDQGCLKNPELYFDSYGNNCFRFNSGLNLMNQSIPFFNSTVGGYDDSIQLKIFTPNTALLIIHNRNNPPHISYLSTFAVNLFWIQKGFNEFKIEKSIEKKLEKPFNNCLKDISEFTINTTLVDIYKNSSISYTQVDCLSYCFELYYIESNPCNCTTLELTNVWDECYTKQNNQIIKECTFKNRLKFSETTVLDKCENYCPLECDTVDYFVSNTFYYGEQSNNYSNIRIYFRNLKYTLITQQAKMSINDLIGTFGGTISLFIGLNFFSLFEIVDLIFEIFFYILSSKNIKNRDKVFDFHE